jgi:hypothetical protein
LKVGSRSHSIRQTSCTLSVCPEHDFKLFYGLQQWTSTALIVKTKIKIYFVLKLQRLQTPATFWQLLPRVVVVGPIVRRIKAALRTTFRKRTGKLHRVRLSATPQTRIEPISNAPQFFRTLLRGGWRGKWPTFSPAAIEINSQPRQIKQKNQDMLHLNVVAEIRFLRLCVPRMNFLGLGLIPAVWVMAMRSEETDNKPLVPVGKAFHLKHGRPRGIALAGMSQLPCSIVVWKLSGTIGDRYFGQGKWSDIYANAFSFL